MVFMSMFVLLVGLSFGARGPMIGATAARIFKGRRFGANFGTIMVGSGVGVSPSTVIGAMLPDWTGGFTAVFMFFGFWARVGVVPVWGGSEVRWVVKECVWWCGSR